MKWTKEHRKEYDKNRHDRSSKEAREKKNNRRKEIRKWFKELKSTMTCSSCPETHPACLEFHHLRDKTHEVSYMVGRGMGKETILAEMAKCEVICANCHAKRHWSQSY